VKQNKYDDPGFFAKYSSLPRSVGGLNNAGEWPAFQSLLADLGGKRVLDLGCGFGWHCRYARQQGAGFVLGVDLSERMLARARQHPPDSAVEYRRSAVEDLDFDAAEFDVVISSLVLHYVACLDVLCRKIFGWLRAGGRFVFSVEHPVFTASAAQQWCLDPAGEKLHWPVDNYHEQGPRRTQWLSEDVVKYHRTIASYVNTVIDSGFVITRLLEPRPTPEMLRERPEWNDERRRPMFVLIAAQKAVKITVTGGEGLSSDGVFGSPG
jgi:2-polyprenyl-3-methyl-5-hydroxy-6-metoxy-1,4-benzoquinol methylase